MSETVNPEDGNTIKVMKGKRTVNLELYTQQTYISNAKVK